MTPTEIRLTKQQLQKAETAMKAALQSYDIQAWSDDCLSWMLSQILDAYSKYDPDLTFSDPRTYTWAIGRAIDCHKLVLKSEPQIIEKVVERVVVREVPRVERVYHNDPYSHSQDPKASDVMRSIAREKAIRKIVEEQSETYEKLSDAAKYQVGSSHAQTQA